MANLKRIFIVYFLMLFMMGCITVNIRSNKSLSFTEKLQNVLIIMHGPEVSQNLLESLRNRLYLEFKEKNIEVNSYTIDPLALDPQQKIKELASQYNPEYFLTIVLTEATKQASDNWFGGGSGGTLVGGVFDLRIYSDDEADILWRASLNFDGSADMLMSSEEMCQKIMVQLAADNLLP